LKQGQSVRAVAEALHVSRNSVRAVANGGASERPAFRRNSQLIDHVERVRDLYLGCKGNLVRVHEELEKSGVKVGYTTLTEFCREQKIGVVEKVPAGKYHFDPGIEMQHDTSPHDVKVNGTVRRLQCASAVLAHSRMIYAQVYPTFNRFYCKTFLTEAIRFFGGATATCMVDNTNVVVAHGTGRDAVMAPEMEAFGLHFGMKFVAHAIGHADRSAHVERQFDTIENNFYPGRTFTDLRDANAQFRVWCEQRNAKFRTRLHAAPITLFAGELPHLKPLPLWIPEVTHVESRRVDVERYIRLHTNWYSVPPALIDQNVEVRETIEHVRIFYRHKLVAEHPAFEPGACKRSTLPAHKRERGASRAPPKMSPEEATLVAAGPEFAAMIALLRTKYHGRAKRTVRLLHGLFLDFPTAVVRSVLADAVEHKAYDLGQVERLILQRVGTQVFRFPPEQDHE